MLNSDEFTRYSRHFNLPDFNIEQQQKLKEARVLVVGAGGLGCPLLLYLTAAGVGHIGIVDPDKVDLSNLHRQVLYRTEDIGQLKAVKAKEHLTDINPNVDIEVYPYLLDNKNALDLIAQYDLVADGTDNFPSRYLINDACVICNKTNVFASIYQFEGQVSVFNALMIGDVRSPNYRDLYPTPPPPNTIPDCAEGGVLGVLAGIVGTLQSLEVIKLITGIGQPLVAQLLLYDALSASIRKVKYAKRADIRIERLVNYDHFCGVQTKNDNDIMSTIKEITVQELKSKMDNNEAFQLIDVREQKEYDFTNIGGELIPMGNIIGQRDSLKKDVDVIVMCRSGQRSAAVIDALQKYDFPNLYNLKGGILAWSREIDNNIPQY